MEATKIATIANIKAQTGKEIIPHIRTSCYASQPLDDGVKFALDPAPPIFEMCDARLHAVPCAAS